MHILLSFVFTTRRYASGYTLSSCVDPSVRHRPVFVEPLHIFLCGCCLWFIKWRYV